MNQEFTVENGAVRLFCQRAGKGEPLLMIHGAAVDGDFWGETAATLSRRFMVVTYDRRGYSRSSAPPDDDYSVLAQAADAAGIIRQIGRRTNIVAHSAGTIIALELAANYPEQVGKVLLYEPPVTECLPERHPTLDKLKTISQLIAEGKYSRASNRFLQLLGPRDGRARPNTAEELSNITKNTEIFIEHEFNQTFFYHPRYEALGSSSIHVALGDLSSQTHHPAIAKALAEKLGCQPIYYPGSHNCPFDLPQSFAYMTAGALLLD